MAALAGRIHGHLLRPLLYYRNDGDDKLVLTTKFGNIGIEKED
jgi:hypothetical protein